MIDAKSHPVWAATSLVFTALVATLIWRAEIALHGQTEWGPSELVSAVTAGVRGGVDWDGLTWPAYSHWAVPVGVCLHLVWLGVFCGVRPLWKRALFVASAAAFAVAAYLVCGQVLSFHYVVGPSAMFEMMSLDEVLFAFVFAVYLIPPAVPTGACAVAWLFGVPVSRRTLVCTMGVSVAAIPSGFFLFYCTEDPGTSYHLNVLKSGLYIPLLIVGLGVPFFRLRPRSERRRDSLRAKLTWGIEVGCFAWLSAWLLWSVVSSFFVGAVELAYVRPISEVFGPESHNWLAPWRVAVLCGLIAGGFAVAGKHGHTNAPEHAS